MFANGTTRVVGISEGSMWTILDLSPLVGNGVVVPPGGMTQCSDQDVMWFVVTNSSGPDSVVQVDMAHSRLVSRVQLDSPLSALWAICTDSTKQASLAGSMQEGRNISYGVVQSNGFFQPLSTARLPSADIRLTALVSIPVPRGGYFMAAYPPGSTSGLLAFGSQFNRDPLELVPISYFLRGASAVHG
jgi:hypothetical protein